MAARTFDKDLWVCCLLCILMMVSELSVFNHRLFDMMMVIARVSDRGAWRVLSRSSKSLFVRERKLGRFVG